jgi:hypothetical protein
MADVYELPDGSNVTLYTEAEVNEIVEAVNTSARRTENSGTGPCHDALVALQAQLDTSLRTLASHALLTAYVRAWDMRVPTEYVNGAWLPEAEADVLRNTFTAFTLEMRECREMEDPSRWVVDPEEPKDPEDEPPAIAGVPGGGALALGLAVAGSVVLGVWLLFKGKR